MTDSQAPLRQGDAQLAVYVPWQQDGLYVSPYRRQWSPIIHTKPNVRSVTDDYVSGRQHSSYEELIRVTRRRFAATTGTCLT